ncbi:MAG: hypothetical protein LBU34_12145, partial [Planctomycetaceae bacterium]|nr:hypothetical protein [Planctomycetaceae bacterium]
MYQDEILSIRTGNPVIPTTRFGWYIPELSITVYLYFGDVMNKNLLRIATTNPCQTNVCDISKIKIPFFKEKHTQCLKYDYSKSVGGEHFEIIIPKYNYCIYSQWYKDHRITKSSFTEWIDIIRSLSINHDTLDFIKKNGKPPLLSYSDNMNLAESDGILPYLIESVNVPYIVSNEIKMPLECLMVAADVRLGVLSNNFYELEPHEKKYVFTRSGTHNAQYWNIPINIPFFWGTSPESWEPLILYFDINNDRLDLINSIFSGMEFYIDYIDTIKRGINILDQVILLGYHFFDTNASTLFLFSSDWNDLALRTLNTMQESGVQILHHANI